MDRRMLPRRQRRASLLFLVAATLLYASAFFIVLSISRSQSSGLHVKAPQLPRGKTEKNMGGDNNNNNNNNNINNDNINNINNDNININNDNINNNNNIDQVLATQENDEAFIRAQKALLQYSSDGQLRAVSSRKYPATTAENSTVLSGFLTRLYDTKSVSENKGRMTPLQLLAYHKQAKQRTTPLTRFFDGIINLDEEAVQVAVEQSSVDEMLLLLFNDWDHDADAFIAALQTLSTEMEVYKSGLKNDNVPAGLNEALKKEKLDSSHLAFIRPDAFRRALYPDDDVKEEGKYQSGKRKLFFLWPRSQSGGSRLLQVIAAIRKAEFERSAFPRPEIFSLAFQSSALFFCSKGISNIVRYTGLPTVKGIANFVTRHTLSYLQLGSASELRLVLARFDRLVLIVCKKGGEQAAATVASSTTPLKDILLNNTLDMRFRLRSALPTFFLQEDQFTGDPNVINWNALKVISSRRLEPESLQFFASLYKGQLPADFVQQLHLLPTSNDVRLVLLSRRQLSPEGKRTGTLADFSSHVLCFPAPSSKTDYRVWSDTVGARLIDFVESPEVTWPSIKEVTGKTLQGVYEQHFRVSVRESSLRMRQQPFLAMSNKSDFKTSEPNKYKPELLVLVVLPPANARGNNDCESSVFHAAHAGSPNDGIQFATTTADDSFALVEELRFIVWGQFSRMPAKFCEVYVFHPDGKVNAMDIQPTELRSPNGGWLALFLRVPNEERKAGLTISHPPVEDYLSALKEIRQEMKKLNSSSVNNVFRSSFYGTADGFAPWFLWLPSREMVPYLIYVQNQTQQQPERDSGKTLKGNSETAVSQDTAILLLHDTSCGTAANHLKAFRLLAKCQKMNLLPALPDMIEYDLSDTYLIPEHNGQRLRSSITNVHEARYSEVYSRLAPFLQNFRQLQPPRLLAMNPTHVITTTSTSRSYDYATGMEKTDVYNGFVRSLVRLVSHVDTRLTPSSLCKCVQEAMFDDAKRRNRYRPSKSKKP